MILIFILVVLLIISIWINNIKSKNIKKLVVILKDKQTTIDISVDIFHKIEERYADLNAAEFIKQNKAYFDSKTVEYRRKYSDKPKDWYNEEIDPKIPVVYNSKKIDGNYKK